jgi:hypothetical protein
MEYSKVLMPKFNSLKEEQGDTEILEILSI